MNKNESLYDNFRNFIPKTYRFIGKILMFASILGIFLGIFTLDIALILNQMIIFIIGYLIYRYNNFSINSFLKK